MSKSIRKNKLLIEVLKKPGQRSEYIPQTKEDKKNDNLEVEQEIECPRCHDTMTLQSDFDRICYLCEECDFLLYLS